MVFSEENCGMQLQGDITYNDEPFKEFYPERTAAYVDQVPASQHLLQVHCPFSSLQHMCTDRFWLTSVSQLTMLAS